jgi:hypothetical protein
MPVSAPASRSGSGGRADPARHVVVHDAHHLVPGRASGTEQHRTLVDHRHLRLPDAHLRPGLMIVWRAVLGNAAPPWGSGQPASIAPVSARPWGCHRQRPRPGHTGGRYRCRSNLYLSYPWGVRVATVLFLAHGRVTYTRRGYVFRGNWGHVATGKVTVMGNEPIEEAGHELTASRRMGERPRAERRTSNIGARTAW